MIRYTLLISVSLLFMSCDQVSGPTHTANALPGGGFPPLDSNPCYAFSTTAGSSEFEYNNISPSLTNVPRTIEHPYGGIVNPNWLNRTIEGTNVLYRDYFDTGSDHNDLYELARLAFGTGSSGGHIQNEILSGCIEFLDRSYIWNGALIMDDSPSTSNSVVKIKYSYVMNKKFSVSLPRLGSGTNRATRGGFEPGGFVYIEDSGAIKSDNPHNPDTDCSYPRNESGSINNNFQILGIPYTFEIGGRVRIGAYAAIGEFFLKDGTCPNNTVGSQITLDVEGDVYRTFRDRGIDDGKFLGYSLRQSGSSIQTGSSSSTGYVDAFNGDPIEFRQNENGDSSLSDFEVSNVFTNWDNSMEEASFSYGFREVSTGPGEFDIVEDRKTVFISSPPIPGVYHYIVSHRDGIRNRVSKFDIIVE